MKKDTEAFLAAELDVLVIDLQRANMQRSRDPAEAWYRVQHALDVALELKRRLGDEESRRVVLRR